MHSGAQMTLPPTARHRGTHAKVALLYSEVGDIWGTANVQAMQVREPPTIGPEAGTIAARSS